MSFSSTVKNELCRMESLNHCCQLAELSAVIRVGGNIKPERLSKLYIKMMTENAAFARRIFSLVKQVYCISPEVVIRRNSRLKKHILYTIAIGVAVETSVLLRDNGIRLIEVNDKILIEYLYALVGKNKKGCCRKAYLRGAFLAGGSLSDPEKTYHLEIHFHDKFLATEFCEMVSPYNLHAKVIKRKGGFVAYLKEGGDIVDFLNIIGAHGALLNLENIRILKEMRNNVNRIVNCETANLEKTVWASVRQVEDINYINHRMGLDNLPITLKEIAELRLLYEDANLKELGEMLSPTLGKSGVNHRLKKLEEIAKELRGDKGER